MLQFPSLTDCSCMLTENVWSSRTYQLFKWLLQLAFISLLNTNLWQGMNIRQYIYWLVICHNFVYEMLTLNSWYIHWVQLSSILLYCFNVVTVVTKIYTELSCFLLLIRILLFSYFLHFNTLAFFAWKHLSPVWLYRPTVRKVVFVWSNIETGV
jgi:hypothetical protein